MGRTVASLAAGAILVAGCVEPPPPLSEVPIEDAADIEVPTPAAESVRRQAQEITVRIRALGCERFSIGSGFVLPGGVIATNRHVIEQPREITVNTWDGRTISATVSGMAMDTDLALVEVATDVTLPAADVRTAPVEVGEPVLAVGYPGGGPATITTGRVLGLGRATVLGESSEVIRIDAPIEPGNSGGPVLDAQGRVIGVVFALETDRGWGLAVPAQALLERIEEAAFAPPTGDC